MIKSNLNLKQAKEKVINLKEKPIEITLSLGRNKFIKFMGKLDGVYNALFTVKPLDESFKGKTAYSYSEYMCGKVKLIEREKTETGS